MYRTPGADGGSAGTQLGVQTILPLNLQTWGPSNVQGATWFRVWLDTPATAVGTYSYWIGTDVQGGPNITDRIRTVGPRMLNGSTQIYTGSSKPIIPTPTPTTSTITVSGIPTGPNPAAQTLSDILVNVSISHPDPNRLSLTLIAPGNIQIPLVAAITDGYNRRNLLNTVFSDDGARGIAFATPPASGEYRPAASLRNLLYNINPNGVWTLRIQDASGVGVLLSWSLEIQTAENTTGTVAAPIKGNPMDQDMDSIAGQKPGNGPGGDIYAVPTPTGATWNPATKAFAPPYDDNTLPLSITGPKLVHLPYTSPAGLPWIDTLNDPVVGTPVADQPVANLNLPVTVGNTTTNIITVTDGMPDAVVSNLQVGLSLLYNVDSDLIIRVTHNYTDSNGKAQTEIVTLADQVGVGSANFNFTVFDDAATTPVRLGNGPYNGSYKPDELEQGNSLANFNGEPLNGTWTLTIQDVGTAVPPTPAGTLRGWYVNNEEDVRLNNSVSAVNVTFDRDMNASTFTVDNLVSMIGPNGAAGVNDWRRYNSPSDPALMVGGSTSTFQLNVFDAYTILNAAANQDALRLVLDMTCADDSKVGVVLVAPNGKRLSLLGMGSATGANFRSTLLADTSTVAFANDVGPYSRPAAISPPAARSTTS